MLVCVICCHLFSTVCVCTHVYTFMHICLQVCDRVRQMYKKGVLRVHDVLKLLEL